MKKKKLLFRPNVWESDIINISKDFNNYYFEIGNEITNDISEGVAIMMRMKYKWNDDVWNVEIKDVDYYNIDPSKCLYWLSGGDDEWIDGENYNRLWYESQIEFQEEFGIIVISIIKKSKTLRDIRDEFIRCLNLSTLYNFAIERGIV